MPGATPNFNVTASSSMISPLRRSYCTIRVPRTHWPRSLSGVMIITWVTRGSSPATAAAAPNASSASCSTIAQVVKPALTSASSITGICDKSSGAIPALVLYPGHMSLRKLSIT